MSTTPETTHDGIPIEIDLKITIKTKARGPMNAVGFKSEIDKAIEQRDEIARALPEGGVITGAVKIGKQKFDL